ncbi:hypothetical protein Cal7507_0980 [Calothrix sp. PCC 7507]|nr:hypothetical protein Cal7507_0980 [Calothrix sp. PCC 7507]
MHKLAKALILALIFFAPTSVFIPEAQARRQLIKVEEGQTVRPAEIRKVAKRRRRKLIRRQARREARKNLNQNFGNTTILLPNQ